MTTFHFLYFVLEIWFVVDVCHHVQDVSSTEVENIVFSGIKLSDLLTIMLQCAALSLGDLSESTLSWAVCYPPPSQQKISLSLFLSATLLFALLLLYLYHSLCCKAPLPCCCHISQFCSHAPSLSFFLSCSSIAAAGAAVALRRPTLVGFGGQQAMTVVLEVDFEVTFAPSET